MSEWNQMSRRLDCHFFKPNFTIFKNEIKRIKSDAQNFVLTARRNAYRSPLSHARPLSNESENNRNIMQRTFMKSPAKRLELNFSDEMFNQENMFVTQNTKR